MASFDAAPARCRSASRSPTCARSSRKRRPRSARRPRRRRSPAPRAPRAPRPPRRRRGGIGGRGGACRRRARRRRRRPQRRRRAVAAASAAAERGQRTPRRRAASAAASERAPQPVARRRRPASGVAGAPRLRMAGVDAPQLRPHRQLPRRRERHRAGRVDPRRRPLPGQPRPRRRPEFAPLITRRMTSEGNIAASGLVPTRYDEDTQVVMRDRRRVSVVFEADAVVLANGQRRERLRGRAGHGEPVHPADLRCSPPSPSGCASAARSSCRSRCRARWTAGSTTWSRRRRCRRRSARSPTFHLKPRPRPTRRNELTVEMWFAPELRYLPVRIRIEQDAADVHRPHDRRASPRWPRAEPRGCRIVAEPSRRQAAMTTYECILTDVRGAGARRIGLITLNRPKQLNALNDALMDELGAALLGVRRRRRHRLHRRHRQREGVRRRRRHRRDGAATATCDVYTQRLHHAQLGDDPRSPQAGDRRGRRLRARRRLRAGDDVRLRHRRRQREVRPARDQARHHPRRRRHAAPAARGRQGEGDGPDPDRAA